MTSPTNLATEFALPSSVRIVAVLLIVQGVVRLAFLANGLITGGARMLVNAPVQFITGFLLPGILGILAITAGIVILVRSPIARGFGLVTGALLLLTQFYFFAAVLTAYSRIQQPPPMFLLATWVIAPAYFLIFIATIICLASWRPRTEVGPFEGR